MIVVKEITVVGAGIMGTGIAYAAALGGIRVHLFDVENEHLKKSEETIKTDLKKGLKRKKLNEQDLESALSNVIFHTQLEASLTNSDFVIEAVPEIMELKINVFKKLDELCKPHVILATNTSTMSPTEIGASTNRPERCIAMHFFNPVHKMKLIEIISGLETSEETLNITTNIARQMNKETVTVNEFPGFVTSRMNCVIGNEAMNMLMEGVASAKDIDKAVKLGLNFPMGPLEMADLVGLDTRLHNMEYLHATLGEKYRPSPLLVKYVKANRLGKKSGKGFYEYIE